jgi:hypothetical protein
MSTMSSNRTAVSLMCVVCAVIAACDGPARWPVVPDPAWSADAPASALAELGSIGGDVDEPAGASADVSTLLATGGRASGRADIQGTPVQNVRDQTYSFGALSTSAFPLAKGQVEVHFVRFTGEEITVHAEVTCLSVLGNQAWVGSRVRRFVLGGEELPGQVGRPMIFRVQDMGEGHGTIDLASLVFFPPPGGDLAHCTTRPAFPILRPSANGNIQVKPE